MISLIKFKVVLLLMIGLVFFILMRFLSIEIQAILFFIYCSILVSTYEDKGVLHPFSWMPFIFFLYSISYPLYLSLFAIVVPKEAVMVIPLNFLGLLAFILGYIVFESKRKKNYPDFTTKDASLRIIGWFLIIICNYLNAVIFFSGVTTKREFLNFTEGNNLSSFFIAFILLALVAALILKNLIANKDRLKVDFFLTSTIITFIFSFGLTGERDLFFRFLLLCALILFTHKYKYKSWKLISGLIIFTIILPITQQLKSFFVSSSNSVVEYQQGDYLNSEFASAGRNLLYLLERDITGYGFDIFKSDILRFFSFLGTNSLSATAWFNNVIRDQYGDGGTSGWGFSLIGEGYIAFGLSGIIVLFILLGATTAGMYNYTHKRFIYCLYLLYIPVFVYILRADLSNFLSLNFKVNAFLIGILFLIMGVLNQNKRNVKHEW